MAPAVFKTVYLFLALLVIPQVLAGPHYPRHEYGKKRHCSKCKHHSKSGSDYSGHGTSTDSGSVPPTQCNVKSTPTLSPTSTPTDAPPTPATTPTPSSPSPSPSPTPASDISTGTGTNSTIQDDAVQAHNAAREKYSASDVTWSDDVATSAQTWANGCVFEHGEHVNLGQNLYAATFSSGNIMADAVNDWMSEASSYDPNNPVASHFTQVVWQSTTTIGCAVANCPAGSIFQGNTNGPEYFVVCDYSPPGNYDGEYAANVHVPSS